MLGLALILRVALLAWALVHLPWGSMGDVGFYLDMVKQSDAGHYPFVDFWMEYPPLFPLLATGAYRLLNAIDQTGRFTAVLVLLMSVVDLVNVLLVYALAKRAHGVHAAGVAALTYAACLIPIWFSLGWFDALPTLTLLWSLLLLTQRRSARAGVVVGLGILLKLFPGLMVLAVPLSLGRRGAGRFTVALLVTLAAVLVPLVVMRADLLGAFVLTTLSRPPWETVQALALGNYRTGLLLPIEDRYAASSVADLGSSEAGFVGLLPQLVLFALALWASWRLTRAQRDNAASVCVLAAIGVATFTLGGKGFSPQYLVWLLPLLLIVWPNWVGLAYTTLLTLQTLSYYLFVSPAIFDYYRLHTITLEQLAPVAWASVLARTLLLAAITGHLLLTMYRSTRSTPLKHTLRVVQSRNTPINYLRSNRAYPSASAACGVDSSVADIKVTSQTAGSIPVHAGRIKALDGLRGIAAVTVVALHMLSSFPGFDAALEHYPGANPLMAALDASPARLLWSGHEAVILFFVLSGFVLSLQLERGRGPGAHSTYASYVIRRMARLYLPYVAVMSVAIVLCASLAANVPQLGAWFNKEWSRPPSLNDVVAIFFLTRDHFETINGPAWSLIHEMRLSLVFPFIALLARRMRERTPLYAAALISIGAQMSHIWVSDPDSLVGTCLDSLQYSALFLLGATVATRRGAVARLWALRLSRAPLVVLGLALVLYATPQFLFPHSEANDVLVGGGAVLLLIIALFEPQAHHLLESRVPQWLGRISYSLYLSHMVVLLTLVHTLGLLTQPWIAVLVTPVVSLGMAAVLHRLIEVPSQRLGRFFADLDGLQSGRRMRLVPRFLAR
jgi:peptidoglycan/LPS O-acetylase OafA/YrhL